MKKLTLFFLLAMSVSCVMAQQNPTNAQEQYQLGLKYLNEQNQERALFWMEKAAHQGLAEAQVHLGMLLEPSPFSFGEEADKKAKAAFEWYKKAAEQNHALGMICLAQSYSFGSGTERNEAKAKEWYQKAIDTKDPGAQYFVGDMLINGNQLFGGKTEENEKKGMMLILMSAEQNYGPALLYWGKSLRKKAPDKAKEFLEKCLKYGDASCVSEAQKYLDEINGK